MQMLGLQLAIDVDRIIHHSGDFYREGCDSRSIAIDTFAPAMDVYACRYITHMHMVALLESMARSIARFRV